MTNPTVCTCTIAYSSDTVPSFAINCPLHGIGETTGLIPSGTTIVEAHTLLVQLRKLVTKWEGQAKASSVNPYAVAKMGCVKALKEVLDGTAP